MFCYIFKEIGRFKKIYINLFSKKICVAPFLIYFFILFTIFFEDITRENYFKQNSINEILVIINILCFGISLILSYKFYFEEKIEEITGEVSIVDSTNIQNKEKIEIIQSNKNYI
jgi:positive regulator of sigma E activity